MTNARYKLLKKLSKVDGATFDEIASWGFFQDANDLSVSLSVLDRQNYVGHIDEADPFFHLFGPGEEALRQERYFRQSHFIAWGTFLTAAASLLASVVSLLLSFLLAKPF